MAHVDILHVPYRGTALAINDLVTGQIQVRMVSIIATLPHVCNCRLKALAVLSETRSEAASDIATISKSGVPGYTFFGWYRMPALAKTPHAVIDALNAGVVNAIRAPSLSSRFTADGSIVVRGTADELGAHLRSEFAKLSKLTKCAALFSCRRGAKAHGARAATLRAGLPVIACAASAADAWHARPVAACAFTSV